MNTDKQDLQLLRVMGRLKYSAPPVKYWLIAVLCFFDVGLIVLLAKQGTPTHFILFLGAIGFVVLLATMLTVIFDDYMKKTFSEINAFSAVEKARITSR